MKIRVEDVARVMGASPWFVRRGLQQGIFPWGYAVKGKSRWTYWINPDAFQKATGLDLKGVKT